jgi:hypothetical protein
LLLTDAQLHEIRQIIADHHTAFVASVISPEAVEAEILERLKEKGLVDVKIASIEDSYLYGQVLASLDSTKGMTYEQFKDHVRKRPVPLTDIEKRAIDMAQHSAGQYAVGLGNRIEQATGNIIYEADADLRSQMREEIQDLTAENIARRESVRKLKSNLGWATKDWARDWDRIAVTEKHRAMQRGQADHIAKRYGDDARVFVRPNPGACVNCLRLYVGPDGNPRIFQLSTLEENGTNFGKKAADWLPVLPPAHPNCQGNLSRIPAGWGFDEHGRLSPKGEGGVEYEDEADLALALMQEDDLQKAFKLQGHAEFQGLSIAIENKPGSVRKWTSPDGEGGETRMKYAYGYVKRTHGTDGDELDVFLGPDPRAKNVYTVHQLDPATGRYDETKSFLGFSSAKQVKEVFDAHYDREGFFGWMDGMSIDHFKRWIGSTNLQKAETFEAGPDGYGSDIVFGRKFLDRCAFLVKGRRFVSWPEAARLTVAHRSANRQPVVKENFSDARLRFSKSPSDFSDAVPFIPKGDGFLKVPREGALVKSSMLTLGHQFKIGGIVVKSIPVVVVDDFRGAKWATENAFHNNSMLKSLAAICPDKPVLCVPTELANMASLKFSAHKLEHSSTVIKRQAKSGEPTTRLVIPAEQSEKAGKLAKARVANIVGAEHSQAANRAPGPSSAANYAFHVPLKSKPPTVLPEDLMSLKDLERRPVKLDKETFEVRAPFHKESQLYVITMGDGIDSEEVERNRKRLDEAHRGNIGPKIQVPVAEGDKS